LNRFGGCRQFRGTACSGDDRGQIDTGRWYLLSAFIYLTGVAFFRVASSNSLLPKMGSSLASRIPYVCDQLLEIPILLTKNRFVAILKKMSVPAVSPLKAGLKRTV